MSANISHSQDSAHPAKKMDFLLLALLLASLTLNVYLGWHAASLKNAPAKQPNPSELAPGMMVQPITVSDLNGNQERLSFNDDGRPTVLYVLSPSCKWCERNMQNIKMLTGPKGESFRFIGLSLNEKNLKEYVDANNLTFPIYKNPTSDSIRALGLKSTPQTIIISP
jgi:hypothetical protein